MPLIPPNHINCIQRGEDREKEKKYRKIMIIIIHLAVANLVAVVFVLLF